jgi:hypothetical protein
MPIAQRELGAMQSQTSRRVACHHKRLHNAKRQENVEESSHVTVGTRLECHDSAHTGLPGFDL